jgi:YidC/Oxa1 family membrane protein insertase
MKITELLVPFALALLGTWIIQTLFFTPSMEESVRVQSGQPFTVPVSQEVRPLKLEVDFADNEKVSSSIATEIETDLIRIRFNSAGAIVDQLFFKRSGEDDIAMMLPQGINKKEDATFLVALSERTPYSYRLKGQDETDEGYTITFEAPFYAGILTKEFYIYKERYQIDLYIYIKNKTGDPVELRVLYPSPRMQKEIKGDHISAIMNTQSGAVTKLGISKITMEQGWFVPTLFGSENKYFIQAMVRDPDQFVQRAYFKKCGDENLSAILEGPVTTDTVSWQLSFYFGPKQRHAVEHVDSRLEQTFDYSGILAPLARLLLTVLIFLFGYVHNYGLAIVVLTLAFRVFLFPFTFQSEQSMKKQMEFRKKMAHLQQKYKNDPQVLARERQELIRKHGMPGLSASLSLLIQMPIFFALNKLLSSSFELYQAPFLWISDLAAPDPYYILPLLICVSMLINASLVDQKQRMMMIGMALVIGAVVANLAAGLALYIVLSTVFGVAQTVLAKMVKRTVR